jgi:guanine deaminase
VATRKLAFYRGAVLNPQSDSVCDFLPDGVVVVEHKSKGPAKIKEVLPYLEACERYVEDFGRSNLFEFSNGVICPGFFDMHFHWVQDDVRLMPKDSLLEWLEKYTFPTEAKYANKIYARKKAKKFFQRLHQTGTIGGVCYSSIHDHALDFAMDEAVGDILTGNVLMTMNSPGKLLQTPKEAIMAAKRGMVKYRHRYVLTPRFAIATDPVTMKATAKEADHRKIFKQSHLSETPAEIKFVMELYKQFPGFKKTKSYTEIYHQVGMLGPRSLMGHAIHLKDAELKLLKRTRTSLVHCPTSNAPLRDKGLGSGLFDFRRIERHGIRWALGSDIGGGPFLSMLDVMRSFVQQHKRAGRRGATFVKALYRATLAGAEILEQDHRTGNLAHGKEANFIVLKKPKGRFKDAETMLAALVGQVKKRGEFDKQVTATFWQGQQL